MIFNLALKFALSALAVVALATGGYYLVKTQGVRTLTNSLEMHLESGDYLAALGAAGNLREEGKMTPDLEEKVAEAARLLVAEDSYKKAKTALDEKRYTAASALLKDSPAVTDASFKYFEEAKKVYEEAEALAAGVAHKTNVALSSLAEQAKTEQTKRKELEQNQKKLEGTLTEKEKAILQGKAETAEATLRALTSQKDAETKQTALLAEQARAQALTAEVEKQSKQKFFTELRTYRDMAQKGREQLDNAVLEIDSGRDITAVVSTANVYIGQGKILFEQARDKASDLRANRTPSAYQLRVDDLVNSFGQFLEASKQLRNALVYLDDKGSAEFTNSLGKGKTALANAVTYLFGVSDFIASNP